MQYDPGTGRIDVWRDASYVGGWTDPTPLTAGAYLSLRTDGSEVRFDDIRIERQTSTRAARQVTGGNAGHPVVQSLP